MTCGKTWLQWYDCVQCKGYAFDDNLPVHPNCRTWLSRDFLFQDQTTPLGPPLRHSAFRPGFFAQITIWVREGARSVTEVFTDTSFRANASRPVSAIKINNSRRQQDLRNLSDNKILLNVSVNAPTHATHNCQFTLTSDIITAIRIRQNHTLSRSRSCFAAVSSSPPSCSPALSALRNCSAPPLPNRPEWSHCSTARTSPIGTAIPVSGA